MSSTPDSILNWSLVTHTFSVERPRTDTHSTHCTTCSISCRKVEIKSKYSLSLLHPALTVGAHAATAL